MTSKGKKTKMVQNETKPQKNENAETGLLGSMLTSFCSQRANISF